MVKIILSIEGMKCVKCEEHMNDAVRKAFAVQKVTSSHEKRETVILSAEDIPEEKLREVVADTGYELQGVSKEPYEKKGLFGFLKK